MKLYEFDRRLRLLVMDAIERIEVYTRTLFIYQIGHKYGTFGHTDAANFHPKFDHAPWLAKLEEEIARSKDVFITHYKNKYAGFPTLPIWMVTEVMSLGSLSVGYRGLKHDDKKVISNRFARTHRCLAGWLHTLTLYSQCLFTPRSLVEQGTCHTPRHDTLCFLESTRYASQ